MEWFRVFVAILLISVILNNIWLLFVTMTGKQYLMDKQNCEKFKVVGSRESFSFESYRKSVENSTASFLLILVHSAPSNVGERMSIRRSWGHPQHLQQHNSKLRFVIGYPDDPNSARIVTNEEEQLGDVMRVDVVDRYKNLSLKSVASLRQVQRHFSHFAFVLKQDDDAFVDLKYLTSWLTKQNPSQHFIAGKVSGKLGVIRSPKSRYYVPESAWKHKYWPRMALGPAYVLTTRSIKSLLTEAKPPWLNYVTLEDAYITGVLRHRRNISIKSIPFLRHQRCSSRNSSSRSFHRVTQLQHQQLFERGRCSDQFVEKLLEKRETQ